MQFETLKKDYFANLHTANNIKNVVVDQLYKLVERNDIPLGVPLESRIKTWESILDKIDRKSLDIKKITELYDLVGVRLILLFRKDIVFIDKIIKESFKIIDSENVFDRLDDSQFGYQSHHYIIKLPDDWLSVPTMSDLGNVCVELQVRTLSQHIWAAASHKLQYKIESNVPKPLRRSIYRVSALLETVDIEFDNILIQREKYINQAKIGSGALETLDVDTLAKTLDEMLPAANKKYNENYSKLLGDLIALNINTVTDLRLLLDKNKDYMIKIDKEQAFQRQDEGDYSGTTKERIENGVFFAHVGLVRAALRNEFGKDAVDSILKASMDNK